MGIVRQVKEGMVNELARKYGSYPNFVLVDFRGLTGRDATNLRKELKAEGVRMNVVKNAVARFALDKIGLKELSKSLDGMNAVVYGEDPVAIAKKLHQFIDKAKVLKVRGGMIEGRPSSAEQIQELSRMPGRKDLQALLVGTMLSPISTFVSTLDSVLSTFVRTLQALEEKLSKS